MASKRRNMFHQNKKQETSEIAMVMRPVAVPGSQTADDVQQALGNNFSFYAVPAVAQGLQVASKRRNMFYQSKKQKTTGIERLNVLYERNWTRLVTEQLRQFESKVIQVVQQYQPNETPESDLHWSFPGSILYSLTVITTIGCGNLGPRSVEGKLATMVYALIGVPLMLVCLSQMGSLLAEAIQSLYAFIHCCGHKPPHERGEYQLEERGGARSTLVVGMGSGGRAVCKLTSVESSLSDYPSVSSPNHHHHQQYLHQTSNSGHSHESDDEETDVTSRCGALNETPSRIPLIWRGSSSERPGTPPPGGVQCPADPPPSGSTPVRVPAVLPLALLCSYLAAGAYLWAKWQSASYLDGLYFAFTALATIGLADLDHRHPPAGPRTAQDQLQLLALAAYLLFGLVLVATAFALVQEQVIAKTRQIATSLGVVKKDTLPI